MHPALEIHDLVESICSEISRSPSAQARGTLASLARVSRFFSEPALDLLWKHQCTLTHLLVCMSPDLWDMKHSGRYETYITARRAIEPEDWKRFHVYARRIRTLTISDSKCHDEFDTWSPVFEMLAVSRPEEPLFPNLQHLSWTVDMRWSPYVHLCLGPRLESFTFGFFARATELAIIPMLPTRCPMLTCIKFEVLWDLDVHCRAQSLMISQLGHLREITLGGVNQSAFEHLSRLPTLESLQILNEPEFIPTCSGPRTQRFPRLRRLKFRVVSSQFIGAFLDINDNWSLTSITCIVKEPADNASVYAVLAAKCDHHTLVELILLDFDPDVLPANSRITIDLLRHLFCFGAMQRVMLAPAAGFDLDDNNIEVIARAWPQVQFLHLRGSAFRCPPSRVTLAGLRVLARHCENLVSLRISFNASLVPEDDHNLALVQQRKLLSLHVDDGLVVDPVPVAAYILSTFPSLAGVDAIEASYNRAHEFPAYTLRPLWKEVERLIVRSRAESSDGISPMRDRHWPDL
ncbi:hypothetical protein K438DRAFT_1986551 [Mycena galopus ATCC 62051]|nr:hypothetical protein K438DRAFT_1986551 [Mycena galopus ATCC 62051]